VLPAYAEPSQWLREKLRSSAALGNRTVRQLFGADAATDRIDDASGGTS